MINSIKSLEMKIDKLVEVANKSAKSKREQEDFKGVMDKAVHVRDKKAGQNDSTSEKVTNHEKSDEVQRKNDKEINETPKEVTVKDTEIEPEVTELIEESEKNVKEVIEALVALLNLLTDNPKTITENGESKELVNVKQLLEKLQLITQEMPKDSLETIKADIANVKEMLGNIEVEGNQFKDVIQNIENRVNNILASTENAYIKAGESSSDFGESDKGSGEKESKDMDTLNSILNGDKKDVLSAKNFFLNKISAFENKSNLPPVRANFAAHDVVKSLKFMSTNDMKELTLKVVPRNLGEIAIKLTVEAGVMKAVISATNKETASLLQSNTALIQEKLGENGMKSESIEVSISHDDTTFHKESDEGRAFKEQNQGNTSKSQDGEVEYEEEQNQDVQDYSINAMV